MLAHIRIATIFTYMYVCGAFTLSFDRKDLRNRSREIYASYTDSTERTNLLLRDVMVDVPIVLVSLDVLAIDETFYSFLQVLVVHRELEFRHDFVDQVRVRQLFPGF